MMVRTARLVRMLPVVAFAAIAGCADSAAPPASAPAATRSFDPRQPGIQITRVYYDQAANERADGSLNEYFVLQSKDTIAMYSWTIRSSTLSIMMQGRVEVPRMLTVYTRAEAGLPAPGAYSLNLQDWLFDERHDTVKLIDNKGTVVSVLAY